jgi:hypothetical protein
VTHGAVVRLAWVPLAIAVGACTASVSIGSDAIPDASASSPETGAATSPDAGGIVGALDAAPDTILPPLPPMTNVAATEREDSVGIDFDPVDNAADYRVYPLPADGDVTVNADGSLIVRNAVYRCAGLRQTFDLPNGVTNPTGTDYPDGGQVYENWANPVFSWSAQIPATPLLGYVFVTPAPDRAPVYAIGVHPSYPEVGWRESRAKIYTTDATQRNALLAAGGRDDGIVFYVPSTASSATHTIYHSETAVPWAVTPPWTKFSEYYVTSADLAAHASDTTPPQPAFEVLGAAADGTQPLMAVVYQPQHDHTELVAGNERFKRAANQGQGPLWHLEWSGLTAPTTLVVEALATGCPYQGFLSAQHLDAPPHQTFQTLDDLRASSPTGEVYVNGQFDLPGATWTGLGFTVQSSGLALLATPNASPVPIARSFVSVSPRPHDPSDWDWFEGFSPGTDLGPVTAVSSCLEDGKTGYNCGHWQSAAFDISGYRLDEPGGITALAYGQALGQLWVAWDDTGQGVTGKVRLSPLEQASIDPDPTKFLHITWSVTMTGSDRRYPQLLVSDRPAPVQEGLADPNNDTLIIQTIQGPSMRIEVQAVHGVLNGIAWDANNQGAFHALVDYDNPNQTDGGAPASAPEPPFEHSGVDRMTRFDAYVSSDRVYLFLDGTPAGCTLYPTGTGFALAGAVTLAFGDVLFDEGAEALLCGRPRPYAFLHEHQCTETKRLWDDLGFKSGVAPPAWDETRFPCNPF